MGRVVAGVDHHSDEPVGAEDEDPDEHDAEPEPDRGDAREGDPTGEPPGDHEASTGAARYPTPRTVAT